MGQNLVNNIQLLDEAEQSIEIYKRRAYQLFADAVDRDTENYELKKTVNLLREIWKMLGVWIKLVFYQIFQIPKSSIFHVLMN